MKLIKKLIYRQPLNYGDRIMIKQIAGYIFVIAIAFCAFVIVGMR